MKGAVGAAKTLDNAKIGIGWGKGIQGQGMPWEDFLEQALGADTRLPANFKTFDYFDRGTGLATSAKTLDTLTPARLGNPPSIYTTLKGYVNDVANFEKHTLVQKTLDASDIHARAIQLAIPTGTTPGQWMQINRAIQYGQSRGVSVIVTQIK